MAVAAVAAAAAAAAAAASVVAPSLYDPPPPSSPFAPPPLAALNLPVSINSETLGETNPVPSSAAPSAALTPPDARRIAASAASIRVLALMFPGLFEPVGVGKGGRVGGRRG